MSLLDVIHSRNVHVEIHEQVFYQGKHQAGLARQRNTSPPGSSGDIEHRETPSKSCTWTSIFIRKSKLTVLLHFLL